MAHTCMGMRASHFVATTVSARRPVAVSASARPSCLAPSAAPQKFCKSFQPNHGLRLLCKKPAESRSIASRQVPRLARPVSRSHVHQLACTSYLPLGMCKGRGLGRKYGKGGSYVKVRYGITCTSHQKGSQLLTSVECRRLGWISFWGQLALSIVSATILSFAVSSSMQASFNPCFGLEPAYHCA